MIKIKEVAFCYAVSDMKKSRIYEEILDLKPNKDFDGHGNPNYVEYDIGPTTLAIGCAPGMWETFGQGSASACLEVEDLDEAQIRQRKRREDHQQPARIPFMQDVRHRRS